MEARSTILGLFPSVWQVGGLEVSGRLAVEALRQLAIDSGNPLQLLFYGKQVSGVPGTESICTTPLQGISFVRKLNRVRHVLVWHLSLLRLVTFLRPRPETLTVYLHGIEAWRKPSWLTRSQLKRVNLFLSNSDFTWARFLEFFPEAARTPHKTVALGIDQPFTGSIPFPDAVSALMISRMLRSENYKGHRELIRCWPDVLRRIPEAELWIAGEGDLRPDLELLSRQLGLPHRVRFYGLISDEQKQQLLLRCRCLALPSAGEGFGIAYLEAMRLGRPCLVSQSDAGQEVVSPPVAGLSAKVSDAAALASAVCELLGSDSTRWSSWSEAARRRYEGRFTAAHFNERLTDALTSIYNRGLQ